MMHDVYFIAGLDAGMLFMLVLVAAVVAISMLGHRLSRRRKANQLTLKLEQNWRDL
jgi:hypothetical protein